MPAEQGELQPTIYRFKFGEFGIANIMDSKVVRDRLHPAFGGERPGGEAEALCRANRPKTLRTSVHPDRRQHGQAADPV